MEGGILLPVLFYALSAVAGIMFGFMSGKKALTLVSSSSTTQQLGSGEEKAKRLDDKGHINGIEGNKENGARNADGGSYSRVPDMRGVDYGSVKESMSSMTGNTSAIATQVTSQGESQGTAQGGANIMAVMGVANAVGAVQNGNINNEFIAAAQKIGNMDQRNSIIANTPIKGVKDINQMQSNVRNTFNRGRSVLYQGQVAQNTINEGKVNVPNLTISGISKANKMFVKKFTVPKEAKMKIEQLNARQNGVGILRRIAGEKKPYALGKANGTGTRTTIFMPQKITNYLMTGGSFTASAEQSSKIISMQQAFSNKQNAGLGRAGLVKLSEVNRITETRLIESGKEANSVNASMKQYQAFFREIIRKNPRLTPEQILAVANMAMSLKMRRDGNMKMSANFKARKKFNLENANMNSLRQIIQNNENIANQFDGFVDEEYRKKVEAIARQNVEKRKDIPLEQLEEEYEKEKERIMNGGKVTKSSEEGLILKQILENPDDAEDIIGKEGVAKLKETMAKNSEKLNSTYRKNLRSQENAADNEYLRNNPSAGNLDAEELREARIKQEIQKAVDEAMEQLKKDMRKEKANNAYEQKRREYEALNEGNGLMAANGGIGPQAMPQQIYISRTAEEQMAKRDV